jgi:protein arginine N-methyltransferase 5
MLNAHSTCMQLQDPIKYARYEEAVQLALLDRVTEDKAKQTVTIIMVVGAGRGPLVQCCLQAAVAVGRKVKMYAIEKNPNAVVTLEARNTEQWGGRVTVVATDMRKWRPDVQADIMVSELLGSFGDNELSPECLDGAQTFLAPNGISIPASSTAFLAPLSAPKLHIELVNGRDAKQLETPYVVLLHSSYRIAEPRPGFHFVHPNHDTSAPDGGPDNTRYGTFDFTATQSAVMHGFAGYFESVLYGDVMISTNPATHSPGMFSWFPIFFPLKKPLYVPAGTTVTINIWRKVSSTKVWYEWACTAPNVTSIHNVNGVSYHIGL